MNKKDKLKLKELIESSIQPNNVSHCTFNGVQFDAKAVDAVQTIASGLVENAKALGALAQVLKASNVSIETLLKVGR